MTDTTQTLDTEQAVSAPDALNMSLLDERVPLAKLTEEQKSYLLEFCELSNLFKGQLVFEQGDMRQNHVYLIYGDLELEDMSGNTRKVTHIDDQARLPIAHAFPRRKTVRALSDAQVLIVPSEKLESVLCWGQVAQCLLGEVAKDADFEEDYLWIKRLLSSRLFYKVPSMNVLEIINYFTPVNVSKGEKLIQEGDEGSCCYLLKQGEADVFVAAQGNEPVARLSVGHVFGDDALVNNKPRNASVVMKDDGVVMKLEKQAFYELLKETPVTAVTSGNLQAFLDQGVQLLDVRTEQEFDLGHHKDAMNLPLHLAYLKSMLLDESAQFITYSSSDERAKAAAYLLGQQGFNASALQGGIDSLPLTWFEKFNAK